MGRQGGRAVRRGGLGLEVRGHRDEDEGLEAGRDGEAVDAGVVMPSTSEEEDQVIPPTSCELESPAAGARTEGVKRRKNTRISAKNDRKSLPEAGNQELTQVVRKSTRRSLPGGFILADPVKHEDEEYRQVKDKSNDGCVHGRNTRFSKKYEVPDVSTSLDRFTLKEEDCGAVLTRQGSEVPVLGVIKGQHEDLLSFLSDGPLTHSSPPTSPVLDGPQEEHEETPASPVLDGNVDPQDSNQQHSPGPTDPSIEVIDLVNENLPCSQPFPLPVNPQKFSESSYRRTYTKHKSKKQIPKAKPAAKTTEASVYDFEDSPEKVASTSKQAQSSSTLHVHPSCSTHVSQRFETVDLFGTEDLQDPLQENMNDDTRLLLDEKEDEFLFRSLETKATPKRPWYNKSKKKKVSVNVSGKANARRKSRPSPQTKLSVKRAKSGQRSSYVFDFDTPVKVTSAAKKARSTRNPANHPTCSSDGSKVIDKERSARNHDSHPACSSGGTKNHSSGGAKNRSSGGPKNHHDEEVQIIAEYMPEPPVQERHHVEHNPSHGKINSSTSTNKTRSGHTANENVGNIKSHKKMKAPDAANKKASAALDMTNGSNMMLSQLIQLCHSSQSYAPVSMDVDIVISMPVSDNTPPLPAPDKAVETSYPQGRKSPQSYQGNKTAGRKSTQPYLENKSVGKKLPQPDPEDKTVGTKSPQLYQQSTIPETALHSTLETTPHTIPETALDAIPEATLETIPEMAPQEDITADNAAAPEPEFRPLEDQRKLASQFVNNNCGNSKEKLTKMNNSKDTLHTSRSLQDKSKGASQANTLEDNTSSVEDSKKVTCIKETPDISKLIADQSKKDLRMNTRNDTAKSKEKSGNYSKSNVGNNNANSREDSRKVSHSTSNKPNTSTVSEYEFEAPLPPPPLPKPKQIFKTRGQNVSTQSQPLVGSPSSTDPYAFISVTPQRTRKTRRRTSKKVKKVKRPSTALVDLTNQSNQVGDASVSGVEGDGTVRSSMESTAATAGSEKVEDEVSSEYDSLNQMIAEAEEYDLVFSQQIRDMQEEATAEIVYMEDERRLATPSMRKKLAAARKETFRNRAKANMKCDERVAQSAEEDVTCIQRTIEECRKDAVSVLSSHSPLSHSIEHDSLEGHSPLSHLIQRPSLESHSPSSYSVQHHSLEGHSPLSHSIQHHSLGNDVELNVIMVNDVTDASQGGQLIISVEDVLPADSTSDKDFVEETQFTAQCIGGRDNEMEKSQDDESKHDYTEASAGPAEDLNPGHQLKETVSSGNHAQGNIKDSRKEAKSVCLSATNQPVDTVEKSQDDKSTHGYMEVSAGPAEDLNPGHQLQKTVSPGNQLPKNVKGTTKESKSVCFSARDQLVDTMATVRNDKPAISKSSSKCHLAKQTDLPPAAQWRPHQAMASDLLLTPRHEPLTVIQAKSRLTQLRAQLAAMVAESSDSNSSEVVIQEETTDNDSQEGGYNICSGISLCMRPANERWRYNITSSLFGWAHAQNDPSLFRQSQDQWPNFGVTMVKKWKL